MKKSKKQISIIIILIAAIAAVACFLFFAAKPGSTDQESTSADQSQQSAQRITLHILLPETPYQDMAKFAARYNDEENKYTIDLIETTTAEGIDPMDYDALIIPGGKHVHPSFYGAEIECTKHTFVPELDQLELDLVDLFIEDKQPILGICRGAQLINVALGGTLKQDIGMGHYKGAQRTVDTIPDTDMQKLYGDSVRSLHYHHQAVDKLADDLTVTMVDHEDGIIEGFVHNKLPIYAVQFHPEKMYVKKDPGLKENGRVFMDYFFDQCAADAT
ncbi:MAG: gamma-glutamyl-gamma-aminobutyrate hydrolase family protein [Bacillota bacterium]|nr:gamma-glutamyl-gamma-aminobutyrate hydrolase family protein [Bacillota bacterium]